MRAPDWLDVLKRACVAATNGSLATAAMAPRAGRSSYLPTSRVQGVADPGAVAAAELLRSVHRTLVRLSGAANDGLPRD